MRPARIITAVVFAAAVAVTGCAAHSTAVNPPVTPVVDAPAPPAPSPAPKPIPAPIPAPKPPVLADGRYDAFIRQVNTRGDYLVVDLVQVFEGQAAVDAAVADGQSRETAQVLYTYIRNQNPRLRTLPLASNLRVDLLGGCEDSTLSKQALLDKLASNAKIAGVYYYTLTVKDGAVQRIDEHLAVNAC